MRFSLSRTRVPALISDGLGWPRSRTLNLVGTLVEKGYLYEPRPQAGYYPTPRGLTLAQAVAEAEPLPVAVDDLVAEVATATGETTAIGTVTGVHALFLAVAESQHQVRYHARVGDRVPIHTSSAGRAILAQHPASAREAVYRRITFDRFSDTTPMSADTVEREPTEAGERGYHQSASEYIADLAGVALPLPLGDRRLSIVVAGPTSRCLARWPETATILRAALAPHAFAPPATAAPAGRDPRRRGSRGDAD